MKPPTVCKAMRACGGRRQKLGRSVRMVLGIFLCAACLARAQEKSKSDATAPSITPIAAGQETFRTYCASCHGLDAKGTGPVAAVLRYKPSDLTQLSKRNGGKFPAAVVENALNDNHLIPAHGSREMPIWSDAFRSTNRDEALVKIKIHNLVLYLESLQEK